MTDQEINEAVARKLGCDDIRRNDYGCIEYVCFKDGKSWTLPDYCHSIGAAWEVVDHLKSIYHGGAAYKLTYDSVDEEWSAWVGSVIGTSATAPMSICLAFLKL